MSVARLRESEWEIVEAAERALADIVPTLSRDDSGVITDLKSVKKRLAERGLGGIDIPAEHGGRGASPLAQALVQFLCGYYDVDLRDSAHAGHGHLIVKHGSDRQRAEWVPVMLAGGLVGIAATEPRGGTNVRRPHTVVRRAPDGLRITGTKRFISRIEEASVFVVFAREEDTDALRAVLVPADTPGLLRTRLTPTGLAGWSWGQLDFDDVAVPPTAVLPGFGEDAGWIFRSHFDYYRPMVAMVALGGAAWVFDHVVQGIRDRVDDGRISRPRDGALERLGRAHVALQSALLAGLAGAARNAQASPATHAWSAAIKAHGVDTAHTVVSDLMPLAGAEVFQRHTHVSKTLRDVRGFTYADGVHDALLAAAGRELMRTAVR
ncbi:acyl-CoA dehydrogenase family protein [Streptomyces sp. B1866]|uniref:acyl-CoA dehydrogenase family protein n=1 Tax=Streptomyces sp. B1866 TaxID=3075431 RepID=UPI00288DC36F|nr:acyl-CoA dehydrogenase family protein [Streptomyces sp. B1866]MDT3396702.1 acyl-CoA dehydrogenase family protein [Streptomyces sp. B1866]